ncbi:MAG: hypothetical protein R3B93_10530 [Bacteroidia bacterium]
MMNKPGWQVNIPAEGIPDPENYPLPHKNELIERIDLISEDLIFLNRSFHLGDTELQLNPDPIPRFNEFPQDMKAYWIYETILDSLPKGEKTPEIIDWVHKILNKLVAWNPFAREMNQKLISAIEKNKFNTLPIYLEFSDENHQKSIYIDTYPHPLGPELVGIIFSSV